MSKFEIEVPNGYRVVNTAKGKWELRKIELPKTWYEFYETHPVKKDECSIDANGIIHSLSPVEGARRNRADLPNKKTAEAFLALMQLIQLRDCYRDSYEEGWKPDWKGVKSKYCIRFNAGKIVCTDYTYLSGALSFPTAELAKQFLDNFLDLIEVARELI